MNNGKSNRGDALKASSRTSGWNFTSAPRWSRDETRTLELCLMKYGIGQWATISSSGLLPGKVIGQLNNQTQRLLGQQSLAVFSGLCVDVERVRKDNEAKTDAVRKGGVIINTGGKLSQQEREEGRERVLERYALTEAQKTEVDREIEQRLKRTNRLRRPIPTFSHEQTFLMEIDIAALQRPEKLDLLHKLRTETKRLYAALQSEGVLFPSTARAVKRGLGREAVEVPLSKRPRRRVKKRSPDVDTETGEADPTAVVMLTDMGFSSRHAVDALIENHNSIEAAVQWLTLNCR